MATIDSMHTRLDQLMPGDRVEVEHRLVVDQETRIVKTMGTLVRSERHLSGMHFRRASDEAVGSDSVLLELQDGELTSIAVDEKTIIRRA